jgi:TPR repeat protein
MPTPNLKKQSASIILTLVLICIAGCKKSEDSSAVQDTNTTKKEINTISDEALSSIIKFSNLNAKVSDIEKKFGISPSLGESIDSSHKFEYRRYEFGKNQCAMYFEIDKDKLIKEIGYSFDDQRCSTKLSISDGVEKQITIKSVIDNIKNKKLEAKVSIPCFDCFFTDEDGRPVRTDPWVDVSVKYNNGYNANYSAYLFETNLENKIKDRINSESLGDFTNDMENLINCSNEINQLVLNDMSESTLHHISIDKEINKNINNDCQLKNDENARLYFYLAEMYYNGNGIKHNNTKAAFLYEKAANLGDEKSQYQLAMMYKLGEGVEVDFNKAFQLLTKSSEQGNNISKRQLGLMLYYGKTTTKDLVNAADFFKQAGENGDAISKFYLGVMYENGEGVAQNYEKAANLYKESANKEYPEAMFYLGRMYRNGKHFDQNFILSHVWFNLSAQYGNDEAIAERNAVEVLLNKEQLAQAQYLASSWEAGKEIVD